MQDRFKFRLWHRPLKIMHYNDFTVTATGYMAKIYQQDDYMMKFNQEDLEFDRQCILMQCTGLKDKNGKLIYEGDIISENWHKYILEWGRGDFQLRDFAKGSVYTFPAGICIEKCEIIGDIYTNPELLED